MTSNYLRIGIDASMLSEKRTGVGNYVFNLLSEAVELGGRAKFYLYSDRPLAKDCKGFGESVENIGPPIRKGPLWMSMGLLPYLKRDKIDVFWGGNGWLPLVAPSGVATVVTIHDLVYHYAKHTLPVVSRFTRKIIQPLSASRATGVVAVSKATEAQIIKHYRRTPDAVIHPRMDKRFLTGSSVSIRQKIISKYSLPERFFFSLGTMEPRKNLVSLLSAYAEVKQSASNVPPLILAGNRGWLDSEIHAAIEGLSIDGSVRWLGFVDQEDMPALYASSELFIFVPTYEGFGMPVREALLSGASVLASDIPALREAGGDYPIYTLADKASIAKALATHLEKETLIRTERLYSLTECEIGSASLFMSVLQNAASKVGQR